MKFFNYMSKMWPLIIYSLLVVM